MRPEQNLINDLERIKQQAESAFSGLNKCTEQYQQLFNELERAGTQAMADIQAAIDVATAEFQQANGQEAQE